MAHIDFGDTPGEQQATLMLVVDGLHIVIHGNGQRGLKEKAETFMNEYAGMRAQQQLQHESNSRKLNLIGILVAVGTLIIGAVGLLVTVETMKRSDLDPAKIFHSQMADPEYAGSRYSATIPRLTR